MTKIFQKRLLGIILIAFTLTLCLSYYIQTRQALRNAKNLIEQKIEHAQKQIRQNNENLSTIASLAKEESIIKTRAVIQIISKDPSIATNHHKLTKLLSLLDIDEIDIINSKGIVTESTKPGNKGFKMLSSEQSRAFLPILKNSGLEIIQPPCATGADNTVIMQYSGAGRLDMPGIIQTGYTPERLEHAMRLADISKITQGLTIGIRGNIAICENNIIISTIYPQLKGKKIAHMGVAYNDLSSGQIFNFMLYGQKFTALAEKHGKYYILGLMPDKEVYAERDNTLLFVVMTNLILFASIFMLISIIVKRVVISGIEKVNISLDKITNGDLNETVKVRTSPEFQNLSDGINSTVGALKTAIAKEAGRIDAELSFAKTIQHSALPNLFPPYPDKPEFDLFASMYTAREVGGDFYDFFLLSENHLALVMADVSDKGIPAALFMMRAKTLLKSLAEKGLSPDKILTQANAELCLNNNTEMFLTAWLGILDTKKGTLIFANAGHNPPLVKNAQTGWNVLQGKRGFILAGIKESSYTLNKTELHAGDTLFLYTDGVTEALSQSNELYGINRVLEFLENQKESVPEKIITKLYENIKEFAGSQPQADDITMLAINFKGKQE